MQQRQLRLGDILDDYCPRERRLTNHAVVAMVGTEVKQTRCTTCDVEHEYKHAKQPRQRRKTDTLAALAHSLAAGPKRVAVEPAAEPSMAPTSEPVEDRPAAETQAGAPQEPEGGTSEPAADEDRKDADQEEGPVHRALIRATLPRLQGQPPPQRPAPQFTIRQPGGGRPGRFRHRAGRDSQPFQAQGNRGSGHQPGGQHRGGPPRSGGRPPMSRPMDHRGAGRKRSK